jgi:hypothetical protein
MLVRDAPMEAFREKLTTLLDNGFKQLESWKAEPSRLEFATKLSPLV